MMRTRAAGFVVASMCLWMMGGAGHAGEMAPDAVAAAKPVAVPETSAAPAGRLTVGGGFGDNSEVYQVDAMIPVLRSRTACLSLNLRGALVPDEVQEASLGLVARRLLEGPSVILGMNGYYDAAETETDNTFGQAGGGVEVLSRWADARANYYSPVTDSKMADMITEEALEGWDAEVGVWLPYLSRHAPTAVYAGYYAFDPEGEGEDIDGFKARLESRLHPNITLDAEWYDDKDHAGSEYYVGLRLHIPLDFWMGVRMHRGDGRIPPFSARLLDPVHRDVRIRRGESMPAPEVSVAPVRQEKEEYRTYAVLDENGDVIYIRVRK